MSKHDGLPVPGYVAQTDERIDLVAFNKQLEERMLRQIDALRADPEVDKRWLAIGTTQLEQAFMAINRAVFRPERATLPEDDEAAS